MMMTKALGVALVASLVWCTVPALAEGDPGQPVAVRPAASEQPRMSGAAWCVVRSVRLSSADLAPDAKEPGCDVGLGVRLLGNRAAWVAAIGTETVGTGGAWVAHRGGTGEVTVAVSVGVAAWYDFETGIDLDRLYLTFGATFGVGRRP